VRVALATWNVHGWVGRDGRRHPARSFEVIRALDADVLALQEVEGSDWESAAREAGYAPLSSWTGPAEFGNALLARLPLARVRHLDLSVSGREPRGAIDAVVSLPGDESLRVVATHLGLQVSERRRQAQRLAEHIGRFEIGLPIVLLGDLNDWTPWGGQLRPLSRRVGRLSRAPTFPSQRPVLALDRAAWRTPGRTARLAVVRSRTAREASDHLPLLLELEPEGVKSPR